MISAETKTNGHLLSCCSTTGYLVCTGTAQVDRHFDQNVVRTDTLQSPALFIASRKTKATDDSLVMHVRCSLTLPPIFISALYLPPVLIHTVTPKHLTVYLSTYHKVNSSIFPHGHAKLCERIQCFIFCLDVNW